MTGAEDLAGIRGRKLYFLVAIVCVLWFIACGILVTNIFLLSALRIGYRGMSSLQFVRSANGTAVVQFLAEKVEMPQLKTGIVGGFVAEDLFVYSDVHVNIAQTSKALVRLREHVIKVKGEDGFSIVNTAGKNIFTASSPSIRLPPGIQRMASYQILTNKIRAPVNKSLKFAVQNLSLRGNEGVRASSRLFSLKSSANLYLETVNNASYGFKAGNGIRISPLNKQFISTSPQLSADVLAFKLCVHKLDGLLFVSEGHKQCGFY